MPNRETMDYILSLLRDGTLSIDDQGRVWRHREGYGRTGNIRIRILDPPRRVSGINNKGYDTIVVQMPNKTIRGVMAHRLMWEWHNGVVPDELQINHKNLIKDDNRLENLEVVTQSENIRHSYANGRPHPYYTKTTWRGKPMITEETWDQLRKLHSQGRSMNSLSKEFGISQGHVWRVLSVNK